MNLHLKHGQTVNEHHNVSWIERVGHKIPDPVILFILFYLIVLLLTGIFGGYTFQTIGSNGGTVEYQIQNMFTTENTRWIFQNAILNNWLAYAGGILGTILIVMFGIGIAEESGLLSTLIRKLGGKVSDRILPYVLVFLGILSNIATDAGYIILIPLAGLLYLAIGKHPIIGMSAAFAGVSAGFSANVMPATVIDVIVGTNTKAFALNQGVPFVSMLGRNLNPFTMHYYFMVTSTVLLVLLGGFVTNKWIRPKFEQDEYVIPPDLDFSEFAIQQAERKALRWSGVGFLLALLAAFALALGPLRAYINADGNEVVPFLDHIILLITFVFLVTGCFYGFASGKFKNWNDLVNAMVKQMNSMGYVIVLTFFCYNFLALLTFSNLGTYITYIGAQGLKSIGLANSPILIMICFILLTALINLFVGGLTSKWMLLGPIFVPMLYQANAMMTPEVVSAAYRVADSCSNTITPLMTYAGVILLYMRKYKPSFTIGDMITTMLPYSIVFLISWTILLILFIVLRIPFGF